MTRAQEHLVLSGALPRGARRPASRSRGRPRAGGRRARPAEPRRPGADRRAHQRALRPQRPATVDIVLTSPARRGLRPVRAARALPRSRPRRSRSRRRRPRCRCRTSATPRSRATAAAAIASTSSACSACRAWRPRRRRSNRRRGWPRSCAARSPTSCSRSRPRRADRAHRRGARPHRRRPRRRAHARGPRRPARPRRALRLEPSRGAAGRRGGCPPRGRVLVRGRHRENAVLVTATSTRSRATPTAALIVDYKTDRLAEGQTPEDVVARD